MSVSCKYIRPTDYFKISKALVKHYFIFHTSYVYGCRYYGARVPCPGHNPQAMKILLQMLVILQDSFFRNYIPTTEIQKCERNGNRIKKKIMQM